MSIFEDDVMLNPEYRRRRECSHKKRCCTERGVQHQCIGGRINFDAAWCRAGEGRGQDRLCAGIMFRRKVGEAVEKGAAIAELYSERSETSWQRSVSIAVVVTDHTKCRPSRARGRQAGPASEPPSLPSSTLSSTSMGCCAHGRVLCVVVRRTAGE